MWAGTSRDEDPGALACQGAHILATQGSGKWGKKAGCNVEKARRRDADGGSDYEEFKTTLAEMNEKIMMQFCIRRKNYLQELK